MSASAKNAARATSAVEKGLLAKRLWFAVGMALFIALLGMWWFAPENLSSVSIKEMRTNAFLGPLDAPPFGNDDKGVPLTEYALQGASIVILPAVLAGLMVSFLATLAGLSRCADIGWTDRALQIFTELVGALPRMVVILVVALAVPREYRSLYPIGLAWALLAAPGAMDEAAATAERLGGARFVEALRAHGFSAFRIYVVHIIWLNLRSVLVRQGAEVAMQVVFLEIAMSYLAAAGREPSFTHGDALQSWASLLYAGYSALIGGVDMLHALGLGLGLVAMVALMAQSFRWSAVAR